MDDTDMNVHDAISNYFKEYYPITAPILTKYYWALEQRTKKANHELPLYGTMKEMCDAYLNVDEFVDFRRELDAASKQTMGDERKRLNILLTSLAYTQLEMYRCGLLAKDEDMANEMKEILKGHNEIKGMRNRDEVGHTIEEYLKLWK